MSPGVAREVGGYEILAKLKSGGMATLYLGKRKGVAGFSRHVAIKFVHDHLAEDQDFVRMFVEEALLQARITHPNVVHVEELGEGDGKHFLVMEYVHGCSLSQLLRTLAGRSRGLSPELAVFIAMNVAAGLHAAHEARDEQGKVLGVVHRDVSPENVLLAYEGHVKLIDFGVAKVEARVAQTSAGLLKGKLRYMSPEQANGREVDRRTDVYALAVVLWEMLTMTRLFAGKEQLELLEAVREPQIPPPSAVRSGIPPALEAVVMRALSVDPAGRYPTAHDFRRALAEALPSALLADASQLGAVLGVVMASEIEKDQRRLPAAVSAVFASAPRPAVTADPDEALLTMTISATGAGYLGDGARGSGPGSQGSQPSSSVPSASGARPVGGWQGVAPFGAESSAPSQASAPAPAAWAPLASAPEAIPAAASASGSSVRWAVAAAVAICGVVGLALVAYLMMGSSEQIRVTPLATPTAAAPVTVPPQPQPPPQDLVPAQPEAAQAATALAPALAPEQPSPGEVGAPGAATVADAPDEAASPEEAETASAARPPSEARDPHRSDDEPRRPRSEAGQPAQTRPRTTMREEPGRARPLATEF